MKRVVLIFVLVSLFVSGLYAQDRFPDLKRYFMLIQQLDSPNWDFSRSPFYGETPSDHTRFSNLSGKLDVLDTYLEMALITYYSAAERPWAERGNSILPLNNPRLVDRQLGTYVYMDLVILRFLGNTEAVGRYETMLNFIVNRGNATRAEIETFYRNGIFGLVSQMVDEQASRSNARINSQTLSAIKNVITDFMLAPSRTTYNALLQAYRRYAGDGARVLCDTIIEINYDVGDALVDNRVLGSQ